MQHHSTYNPLLHHRRSIRLKGYDYSRAGLYFITICIQNRQCLFGHIQNGEMHLSEYGCVAAHQWEILNERFPHIELDAFQIMPNHMHGIVHVGATFAVAQDAVAVDNNNRAIDDNNNRAIDDNNNRAGASPAPTTIGGIVGAYKSLVANECLKIHKQKWAGVNPALTDKMMGKLWQRNYYEHIVRNETSYHQIRNYIINNPAQWDRDKFNPSSYNK